jgi:hypothetical protein
MYESKREPGRKFGSAFVGKRFDKGMGGEGAEHESKESPEFEAGEQEGMKEKGEQHPVVAAHGPAHTVTIKHDHKRGKHSVESHHDDGHRNLTEHETPEQAHEEGGSLANVSLKTSGEAGDQQGAASEGDNDHTGGFVMPQLS